MREILRHASKFDELLVQLRPQKDPAIKVWIRKAIKVGSVAFMFLGAGFLFFFLWKFISIFIINNPAELTFAQFWGNFGDAAGGAINMMGLGGLIYSLLFVAEQVKGEKEARLQQDMPVVFVAPRLAWSLRGASERKLIDRDLRLSVGFRNSSDAAAAHVVFNIDELVFRPTVAEAKYILRNDEELIDNLPGHEFIDRSDGADNYHVLINVPLTDKCPGLLDAIFHQDSALSAFPSLEMRFSVSFHTIRGASFYGHASAIWSPKHCREVRDSKQAAYLCDFGVDRKKFENGEIGLDKYFQGADRNPLVPSIVEDNPEANLEHSRSLP